MIIFDSINIALYQHSISISISRKYIVYPDFLNFQENENWFRGIKGKIVLFDLEKETTFGSSSQEFRKIEHLRDWFTAMLIIKCIARGLYIVAFRHFYHVLI